MQRNKSKNKLEQIEKYLKIKKQYFLIVSLTRIIIGNNYS